MQRVISDRPRQISNAFSTTDNRNIDRADHGLHTAYRVSPAPKNPVPTIRKKKNRLLNTDTIFYHAMPSRSSINSTPALSLTRNPTTTSQTTAIASARGLPGTNDHVSEARSEDTNHHATSARPPSIASRASRISSAVRNSSLKHRMLNRLASGFLPPQNKDVAENLPIPFRESSALLHMGMHQPVAQAELTIRQADMTANNSAFFAIDIACSITADGKLPLNVAFLIDNSLYSSPANLLAGCETVAFIASLLNLPHDQFTLYHSNPAPSRLSTTFYGGQTYRLRSLLDTIRIETTKPKASYLRRAVDVIRDDILVAAEENTLHQASQIEASAHIIVITAHPFALNRFVSDNGSQVHIVCSGSIPWELSAGRFINGWCLINKSPTLGERNHQFLAELRSLIRAARSGFLPAHLENVRISVNSGAHSMIEGLLGSTNFPLLGPGEVRTIFAKVRLTNHTHAPASLSAFPRDFRTTSGRMDIEKELDAALHHEILPVLSVRLEYAHSALAAGTICKLSREVHLRSNVCGSPTFPSYSNSMQESDHLTVQARLAFHSATCQNQRRGIRAILTQFPDHHYNEVLSRYTKEIVDELKFQSRILNRIEPRESLIIASSPKSFRFSLQNSPMTNSNNSQTTIARPDNELTFPKPPSPLRPRKLPNGDSDDQARRIWTALRLKKNPSQNSPDYRKPQVEPSTETLRDMKTRAENNNRSLGEDTIRSLRMERMQENVAPAPWL